MSRVRISPSLFLKSDCGQAFFVSKGADKAVIVEDSSKRIVEI
ncbi:MAG: hypothetical protein ACFNVX_04245 [Lachnoanaerobaculum saburreum]